MIKTKKNTSKLGFSLLALIFAFGFSLAGYQGGHIPMAKILQGWWRADDLVSVQARIDKLELLQHDAENSTSAVKAEFIYEYNGQAYRSRRINVGGDSSDNIGSYQHDIHSKLKQAYDSQQSVTLWMDPQAPAFAVYDRQVRMDRILFLLPFAILFPLVGLGSFIALWFIWRTEKTAETSAGNTEASLHAEASLKKQLSEQGWLKLKANSNGSIWLIVFTICWGGGCFLTMTDRETGHLDGRIGMLFLGMFFLAIEMLLIFFSIRTVFLRWRLGATKLWLAQIPCIGLNDLTARLQFSPELGLNMTNGSAVYPLRLEINCIYIDHSGEDRIATTLWAYTFPRAKLMHGASYYEFTIGIPDAQPPSGSQGHVLKKVSWELRVTILGDTLVFDLPVQAAVHVHASTESLDHMVRSAQNQTRVDTPAKPGRARLTTILPAALILSTMLGFSYFLLSEPEPSTSAQVPGAQPVAQAQSVAQLQASLDAGADVNARDSEGRSLLMQAVNENNHAKLRLLLQRGAQVDLATPVDAEGKGGRTAVFAAIEHDNVESLQALADAGAYLHKTSNQVWTPVHYAAYAGATKSLRYLHERGLDMNEGFNGGRGSTPLMIAAQNSQLSSIEVLLQAGVDRDKKDVYGEDACGYARFFKQAQAAQALVCGG